MTKTTLGLALVTLLTLGAGCTLPGLSSWSFLPKDLPAGDVDLNAGSTITLEQNSLNPLDRLKKKSERVITIGMWSPNDSVELSWDETFERETADSIAARNEAERATGVGEEAHVPEPVYETVSLKGSLTSDALDDGRRILLPSAWSEDAVDFSGTPVTLLWVSRTQYDELAVTRHTHLSLSAFDDGLQQMKQGAEFVKDLLVKFQVGDSLVAGSDEEVTEIVASADWGSYTLTVDNEKVSVPTIQAENKFASYTILANPDNPLILKVELKAWAYGTEALGFVSDDLQMSGYAITELKTSH